LAGRKTNYFAFSRFEKMFVCVKKRASAGSKGIEFPLSFELAGFPAGVVTVTDAYHLLLATVFVDAAQRIRFKICQRKDCGKPFPLENKHKKKFCCWYCGHITTVRRNRPRSGSKKKA
jgi:hypothetical protein